MATQQFAIEFKGYWLELGTINIPSQGGVYCVYECTYNKSSNTVSLHKLIYVGESENISDRIVHHEKKQYWWNEVSEGNHLCFSFAYVVPVYRERIEAALIFEHKSPVNDEYTHSFPFDKTTISITGKIALLETNFTVERTA